MENTITFEVWSLPSTGAFVQKFPITAHIMDYEFTHEFGVGNGDGVLHMDPTFDRFREIIYTDPLDHSNDVGSVVRVLKNGAPYRHYMAARLPENISSEAQTVPLTLRSMNFNLDKWRVGPYDHDAALPDADNPNPSRDPDWAYGAESALTFGQSISNEIQQIWRSTGMSSGTFTVTDGVDATSAMAWNVSSSDLRTRLINDIASINDVLVVGEGTALFPYEIEFTDPKGNIPYTLAIGTNATNGVFSTDTLREGGTLDPSPWTQGIHPVTKRVHGNYQIFDVVDNTIAPVGAFPTGDTHVLRIDPDSGSYLTDFPSGQQLVSVTGGTRWRAQVQVFAPTTGRWFRLVIRDMQENEIASTDAFAPADTLTTLSLPTIDIPIGVDQVIFRVGILHITNIAAVYVAIQSAQFAQGFPPAPWGEIVNDLNPQITLRTSMNDWVTRTWTNTLDSSTVAWDRDLSWLINHRQSLQQLCEISNEWGYESTGLYWSNANTRFEWGCYNLSNGGTDLTGTGFKIGMGDALTFGEKVSKLPATTAAWAFGTNMAWGRATDATMVSKWGVLEEMSLDRQGQGEMVDLAAQMIQTSNLESATQKIRVHNLRITPGVDFDTGDYIDIDLGPAGLQGAFRVAGIVEGKTAEGEEYADIHIGALVKSPETAQADAVRTLWRKMELLDTTRKAAAIDPSGYVVPPEKIRPYVVAAYNSSDAWKAVASYVCTGINDQLVIQQVIDDAIGAEPWGARPHIYMAAGDYTFNFNGSANLLVAGGITIEGASGNWEFNTVIYFDGTATSLPRAFSGAGMTFKNIGFALGNCTGDFMVLGLFDDCLVDNCFFSSIPGVAVWMSGWSDIVSNCIFWGGWAYGVEDDMSGIQFNGVHGVIENCHFENNTVNCIRLSGFNVTLRIVNNVFYDNHHHRVIYGYGSNYTVDVIVQGNHFIGNGLGATFDPMYEIYLNVANGFIITDNYFTGGDGGVLFAYIGASWPLNTEGIVFSNNVIYKAIESEPTGEYGAIHLANTFYGGTPSTGAFYGPVIISGNAITAEFYALTSEPGFQIQFVNNSVYEGQIWLVEARDSLIADNSFYDGTKGFFSPCPTGGVITLDACQTMKVQSNQFFDQHDFGHGVDAMILLQGACVDVELFFNTALRNDAYAQPSIDNGIVIGASCVDIKYIGNHMREVAVAPYVNNGTGSINTWPAAGGSTGDNFT